MISRLSIRAGMTRTHRVQGGGGVELFVEETGNEDRVDPSCSSTASHSAASPGAASCAPTFATTCGSWPWTCEVMACRRVPADAYGESSVWAQDVHAVITALGLDRPDPVRLVVRRGRHRRLPAGLRRDMRSVASPSSPPCPDSANR